MPNSIPFIAPSYPRNFLLNSAFDYWQAGVSVTIANATSTYQPDQWYGKNSLGTNGILTLSQVTGVQIGSSFGAQLQITTAPTAAQANGCELYQTLENRDSIQLYGRTASFSVLVKGLNNVTQVGVQFFYSTTEIKVATAIGSEILTTVNSSSFVACTIPNQNLGTAQTTTGVIGVRIRVTGVSSGNTYDINNGFVCEQAQLNLGNLAPYQRAGSTIGDELQLCLRHFEKIGGEANCPLGMGTSTSTTSANWHLLYKVTKRTTPTVIVPNLNKFRYNNTSNNFVSSSVALNIAGVNSVALTLTVSGVASSNIPGSFDTVDATGLIYIDARI